MTIKRILLIPVFFGILITACKNDSEENDNIETEPIVFTKEAELYLLKAEGDTVQKLDIEIADNDYERETGLMYRESMEENQGMLFVYNTETPRSFYMKNTYIPLDLIFYDRDSTAVSFQENAEPLNEDNLPSGEATQYILEINAGLVEKWNIEAGDKFSVVKASE
ncbi:DUF192 domain-containing protein [Salegentibacter sp. F188]|uniref:DUF192 domain-containing protein n=1 Tax=Autumnicola patrickiae TaxID=3075591 RepID=A0ABU3E197_9FLAO|nr:DUF192 domain-containing protein [Salegentibacter sp. F188]MDT0689459.1 DUF192 domain-containing protein [Salegentibacter sp. F188]